MTGPLMLERIKSINPDPENMYSSDIVILPKVPFELIEPNHDTRKYFENLVKWICANYPGRGSSIYIGEENPNSTGIMIIHIYSTADVNEEGFPRYASGTYFPLTCIQMYRFECNNFEFRCVETNPNPTFRYEDQAFRNITLNNQTSGYEIIGTMPVNINYGKLLGYTHIFSTGCKGVYNVVVEPNRNVYLYFDWDKLVSNGSIGVTIRYCYYL